jgi:phage-related protein
LKQFPDDVQDSVGYALYLAQIGEKHPHTKPLRGHRGAGVLEVVEDYDGDAYRAVYTVRFDEAVYVLHCFQKKSTRGIATAKRDSELIAARLQWAHEIHERGLRQQGR